MRKNSLKLREKGKFTTPKGVNCQLKTNTPISDDSNPLTIKLDSTLNPVSFGGFDIIYIENQEVTNLPLREKNTASLDNRRVALFCSFAHYPNSRIQFFQFDKKK